MLLFCGISSLCWFVGVGFVRKHVSEFVNMVKVTCVVVAGSENNQAIVFTKSLNCSIVPFHVSSLIIFYFDIVYHLLQK